MRSKKSTELRSAAGPPAGKAARRRRAGSDCGHLFVFDAHPGRKGAVGKRRLRLPKRPDEIPRLCREAQTLAGGGKPRRFGRFSGRTLPAKTGKQERGTASRVIAEFLSFCP